MLRKQTDNGEIEAVLGMLWLSSDTLIIRSFEILLESFEQEWPAFLKVIHVHCHCWCFNVSDPIWVQWRTVFIIAIATSLTQFEFSESFHSSCATCLTWIELSEKLFSLWLLQHVWPQFEFSEKQFHKYCCNVSDPIWFKWETVFNNAVQSVFPLSFVKNSGDEDCVVYHQIILKMLISIKTLCTDD